MDSSRVSLWAFIKTPAGFQTSWIGAIRGDYSDFNIRSYRPMPGVPLVQVLQVGDYLFTYNVDGGRNLVNLEIEYSVSDYWIDERPEGAQFVVYSQSDYPYPSLEVYTWNPDTQTLDKHSLGYDYGAAKDEEADRLLFQEQDYGAAITYIRQFLQSAPPEPVQGGSCYDVS
jgi:hypothetical protein